MSSLHDVSKLLSRFDPRTGTIDDQPRVERHLTDLRGCFRDAQAYDRALAAGNPLVYSVAAVEPAHGDGDLHYGLGVLHPGVIGDEYFLTKGHMHTWRDAAEVYIGLAGEGTMLLEDETGGGSRMVRLQPNAVVYVPGNTAHRTVNTGNEPLVYLGVYPARAGHDYGVIAKRNFSSVVVKRDGQPTLMPRE
jgi:glucose-6-phosphate isomerase, archaeal